MPQWTSSYWHTLGTSTLSKKITFLEVILKWPERHTQRNCTRTLVAPTAWPEDPSRRFPKEAARARTGACEMLDVADRRGNANRSRRPGGWGATINKARDGVLVGKHLERPLWEPTRGALNTLKYKSRATARCVWVSLRGQWTRVTRSLPLPVLVITGSQEPRPGTPRCPQTGGQTEMRHAAPGTLSTMKGRKRPFHDDAEGRGAPHAGPAKSDGEEQMRYVLAETSNLEKPESLVTARGLCGRGEPLTTCLKPVSRALTNWNRGE